MPNEWMKEFFFKFSIGPNLDGIFDPNILEKRNSAILNSTACDRKDLQLRLVSLARGTSDLLGGLKRCFEGFVSPRNSL